MKPSSKSLVVLFAGDSSKENYALFVRGSKPEYEDVAAVERSELSFVEAANDILKEGYL